MPRFCGFLYRHFGSDMFFLIALGFFLYFAPAFAFFTLSAMELAETGRNRTAPLATAFTAALLWPLTLSVMTALVIVQKTRPS